MFATLRSWAKKLDCWKAVQEIPWTVPTSLEAELI